MYFSGRICVIAVALAVGSAHGVSPVCLFYTPPGEVALHLVYLERRCNTDEAGSFFHSIAGEDTVHESVARTCLSCPNVNTKATFKKTYFFKETI